MVLSLEDVETVAERFGKRSGLLHVPLSLADFIAEFVAPLKPNRVLDAHSISGVLPLRLSGKLDAGEFDVLSPNEATLELVSLVGSGRPGIEFHIADPMAWDDPPTPYDLVVCSPPFGLRTHARHAMLNGEQVRVQDDLAQQLILRSCHWLRENGVAVFVVASSFLTRATRDTGVLTHLQSLGFQLDAAIELPASTFRHAHISAQLVVLRRGSSDRVFAARMPSDDDSRRQLISNYHKGKQTGAPALGMLADRTDFRGFGPLELELSTRRQAREMGLQPVPFGDVVIECRSARSGPNFKRFEDEQDCVFLPEMANSPATTTQAMLSERLRSYFRLKIDPSVASPEYLAGFLNSPFGHTWRNSLKLGAAMPRITRSALVESTFYLPPRQTQLEIVACDSELNAARSRLTELSDRLWQSPQQVEEITAELQSAQREDTVEQWIDSLPFPLASVLWLCHVEAGGHADQIRRKLQFFEALTQFVAIVHMSAFSSDLPTWKQVAPRLQETFTEQGLTMDKATFGMWNVVSQHLIPEVRELMKSDWELVVELYRTSDRRLLESLTAKRFLSTIQQANSIRNKWSHESPDPQEVNSRLSQLIDHVRAIFGFHWENYNLLLPGQNEYDSGVFRTDVQQLQGTRQPFPWSSADVLRPMQKGSLHLKAPDQQQTLELLPLVKILAPPTDEQNACYFYNSRKNGEVSFTSYHFRSESTVVQPFNDTQKAIGRLFQA